MPIADYEYTVEQCDVPQVRQGALREYREFRRKCLEYLRGDADSSVMNQVHGLAWYTAVFRTLNEARRLEQDRAVNGAMWELITAGYANIMGLGIRKLVDRDHRTDSVWNVVGQIEKHPEFLRRENFVCYDGLPFDAEAALKKHLESLDPNAPRAVWVETKGPRAWGTSQIMHKTFDALAGYPDKPKRLDMVQPAILAKLKVHLEDDSIKAVCTMADKTMAHAERLAQGSDAVPIVTYNMIDQALRHIVQVASFVSSHLFGDTAFGSVVPVPQFDVLEDLDQPWVKTGNLPALHEHWREVSETLGSWADQADEAFMPRGADAPNPD